MALVGGFIIVSIGTKWRFSEAGMACSGEGEFDDTTLLTTCDEGEGCFILNQADEKEYRGLMY